MSSISALDVAYFFVNFTREHGDYLTNLKLQKLLYFAQGWHLAIFDKPLFDDEIQAWVHGPVVPTVYNKFKRYSYNPITDKVNNKRLSKNIQDHLENIFGYYGKYSAFDLEKISHDSDPWINARHGLAPDEPSSTPITIGDMKSYYTKLMLENNAK